MNIKKTRISNSPFLGVNSFCSKDFCIVPNNILEKENKILKDNLKTNIIKTPINQSPLVGVYLNGIDNKIIVGKDCIMDSELKVLEDYDLKIKEIEGYNALGNLLCLNKNFGIASSLLSDKTIKEISNFLDINIEKSNFEIPGAFFYANDYMFISNPNIKEKEFEYLSKKFNVISKATTLNYGDSYVGNDIISNRNALLVGDLTSNIELMKVDEIVVEYS